MRAGLRENVYRIDSRLQNLVLVRWRLAAIDSSTHKIDDAGGAVDLARPWAERAGVPVDVPGGGEVGCEWRVVARAGEDDGFVAGVPERGD